MNRRELFQMTASAAAGYTLVRTAFAQASAEGFALDAYSRNLQWCRTPQDLGKSVTDIGLSRVDLTVGPAPAHVAAANARKDLPAFARGLKDSGVTVSAITCDITDADSVNAEAILDAASSAGIHHYGWGGFTYAAGQPYAKQLDALKPRVAKLAKLNEKYEMKALYQPKTGTENVGSAFFDFLTVLQNFDPRFVAFRYDTGALLQASPQTTVTQLRMGAAYIGGVAINDAVAKLELPVWDQGEFTDSPELLTRPNGGGDNTGNAGGDPYAYGGGGRRLPYHVRPVQVGTGMIDLESLGATLKEIGFNGPAECQVLWELAGVEKGTDKLTVPRQRIIGLLKRDRLIVEQGFQKPWNINVLKPSFMDNQ
jgi:sugar phosphate isomerase/epimerase